MGFFDYIILPFGWIFRFFYGFLNSYGLSLLLFTIATKVLLLPLSVKQHKSQIKSSAIMARVKPRLDEATKKYKGNPQKLREEQQKIYDEEGYSMMGGCLPLLIQFPVLLIIYQVVYKPITFLSGIGSAGIDVVKGIISKTKGLTEIVIIHKVDTYKELEQWAAQIKSLNFDFLGISLLEKPEWTSISILIPILSGLSSFVQTFLTQKLNPQANQQPGNGMKFFTYLAMPAFSFFLPLNFPTALGLYWLFSNIVMIIQTLVLYNIYNPRKLIEAENKKRDELKTQLKEEKRLARTESLKRKFGDNYVPSEAELEEPKDEDAEINTEDKYKGMSKKEADKQKLEDARKRMAKKYGD